MIAKPSRLPAEEFKVRGYKTVPTPFFLLKVKKNNLERPRVGIVIGKSAHKTAAKRNFWKRQAKAGFLKQARGGNDFLMIFLSPKSPLTKKQFQETLITAINNAQKK